MSETDIWGIWKGLEEEVKAGGTDSLQSGLVRRLVADTPAAQVHFAITVPDKLNVIMIAMPESWNEDLGRLPRWTGMRPAIIHGVEKPRSRRFLLLRQEQGSPTEVFRAVASDLYQALARSTAEHVEKALIDRLDRWKSFFALVGPAGLSHGAQVGLFGELWLLMEHLIPVLGPSLAVAGWTGPKHANHDFQYGRHCLEVKSSTAKQHHQFQVTSERQLETTGLDSLVVVYISFAELETEATTLPAMIHSIREKLGADSEPRKSFEEKLIEAGYIDAQSGLYRTGYSHRTTRMFDVSETFPRLLEKDLPQGVGDLSYSVMLSACEPFKIPAADVWRGLLEERR